MDFVEIGNKQFKLEIKRKFIRSIRLKIINSHRLSISCPHLTQNRTIHQFIQNHSLWITKNSAKIRPKIIFKNLKNLSILGQNYQLFISKTNKNSAIFNHTDKKIYFYSSSLSQSSLQKLIDKNLRPLALLLVNRELKSLSQQFGFKYQKVTVRNQKTRLGSCSSAGNLNFNWQIIFFPPDKFRHILLHELTHLAIKDHSSKFWSTLQTYDPDTPTNKKWLKTQSSKLLIFS